MSWTFCGDLASCSEAAYYCSSLGFVASCSGGAFGGYACSNGCVGRYCPNPPCPITSCGVHQFPAEGDTCENIKAYCSAKSWGDLLYADVQPDGGMFSCAACGDYGQAMIAPPQQGEQAQGSPNSHNPKLLGITFGIFFAVSIVLYASVFLFRHFCLTERANRPDFNCCSWRNLAKLVGLLDEHGERRNCLDFWCEEYPIFKVCRPKQTHKDWEIRIAISGFMVGFALSIIFQGIALVSAQTCYFAGGWTKSNTDMEPQELELKSNAAATVVITLLTLMLSKSIDAYKSCIVLLEKPCKYSAAFELTWIVILLSCSLVEKKLTSNDKIPHKYTLYFTTAVIAIASGIGTDILKSIAKYTIGHFALKHAEKQPGQSVAAPETKKLTTPSSQRTVQSPLQSPSVPGASSSSLVQEPGQARAQGSISQDATPIGLPVAEPVASPAQRGQGQGQGHIPQGVLLTQLPQGYVPYPPIQGTPASYVPIHIRQGAPIRYTPIAQGYPQAQAQWYPVAYPSSGSG